MASSGIPWVDGMFDWAVIALVVCAKFFGITYEEINVWIFCILWPVLTIGMIAWISVLIRNNRRLKRQII